MLCAVQDRRLSFHPVQCAQSSLVSRTFLVRQCTRRTVTRELSWNDAQVVGEFKKLNPNVPSDPREQLRGAILAVFKSWNNDRAIRYRSYNSIPDDWGTAVSVQAMAYGNMNDGCGTGVAFSRNPSTGEDKFFGGELRFC